MTVKKKREQQDPWRTRPTSGHGYGQHQPQRDEDLEGECDAEVPKQIGGCEGGGKGEVQSVSRVLCYRQAVWPHMLFSHQWNSVPAVVIYRRLFDQLYVWESVYWNTNQTTILKQFARGKY